MLNLYKSLASERHERLEFLASELDRQEKPDSTKDFLSYIDARDDNNESDYQWCIKLIEEGKYE